MTAKSHSIISNAIRLALLIPQILFNPTEGVFYRCHQRHSALPEISPFISPNTINMRQLLFAIIVVSTGAMTTFAQTASAPVTKDSATENQKFYFPASNYADSVALITAM